MKIFLIFYTIFLTTNLFANDRQCTHNDHCNYPKSYCNIPTGASFGYCGYQQGTDGDLCEGDWECGFGYLCDQPSSDSYGTCKDSDSVECYRNPNCSVVSF